MLAAAGRTPRGTVGLSRGRRNPGRDPLCLHDEGNSSPSQTRAVARPVPGGFPASPPRGKVSPAPPCIPGVSEVSAEATTKGNLGENILLKPSQVSRFAMHQRDGARLMTHVLLFVGQQFLLPEEALLGRALQAAPTLWVREEVGNQSMSSPRNSERQTIHHQTGRAKLHAGERKYCDTHLGVARKLLRKYLENSNAEG